jgi:hypothetical protein
MAFEYDFELDLERQAKKFRGELSGAGCGFGVRDINFVFKSERSAERFKAWLGRRRRVWRIKDVSVEPIIDEE